MHFFFFLRKRHDFATWPNPVDVGCLRLLWEQRVLLELNWETAKKKKKAKQRKSNIHQSHTKPVITQNTPYHQSPAAQANATSL